MPRKTCAPPKCCHYAATTQGWVNTLARVVAKLRFGIEIIAEINNITFLKFILPSDHEVKTSGVDTFIGQVWQWDILHSYKQNQHRCTMTITMSTCALSVAQRQHDCEGQPLKKAYSNHTMLRAAPATSRP